MSTPQNFNLTEMNVLHLMIFVVGSFFTLLVIADLCDPRGTSYHNFLMGKKNDEAPSKYSNMKLKKKDK